jgi:hypothetical protein
MSALPQLQESRRRRIVATAALLSSAQDGERLAAVRGLDRLLAPHGVGIADVVEAGLRPVAVPRSRPPAAVVPLRPHQLMARQCLAYPEMLTEWEAGFVASVADLRSLSDKQLSRLRAIAVKAERGRR